jgi:excisionase family DNA binding protein
MKNQTKPKHELLGVDDVLGLLPIDVSMATIYRWIRRGARGVKLQAARVGGRYFFKRSDVEQFLNSVNS